MYNLIMINEYGMEVHNKNYNSCEEIVKAINKRLCVETVAEAIKIKNELNATFKVKRVEV